jgi:hypothetical protein
MDPLRGNAEQTSASTAAVMSMNTMVMRYDDLREKSAVVEPIRQDTDHIAAGPPARRPKKKKDLGRRQKKKRHRRYHQPDTADKIERRETGREIFYEVPATMELLQNALSGTLRIR